jgi:hypothetical protein
MECRSLAAKWEQLSGYIGLSYNLIEDIKGNHPSNNSACWNEALKQWIQQNYETERFGKPSWRTLLKAIALVDRRLFTKIAADHRSKYTCSTVYNNIIYCVVADSGFLEGGSIVLLRAKGAKFSKPCPLSGKITPILIVFEMNYQSNRSVFEQILC